ncbi:MAG: copper resistance protein CopC [Acidimicrobiia bacterium]
MAAAAGVAGAHTQLQEASPAPAEEVGGTVDQVRLDFLDPLLEAPNVVVTGPDGAVVDGAAPAELVADDVAVAAFDPLEERGRYTVTYDYASLDGAPQQGAHTFTFTGSGGGGIELRPALAVLVAAALVALAARSALAR